MSTSKRVSTDLLRVQSHIAAALVNFCEKFKASTLQQYLPSLLGALHTLLKENRKQYVTEQVVTAIASVAGCAEKYFTEYYDLFMPILKDILMLAKGEEQTMLRGKAMECISLIGIAVGKEKFRNGKYKYRLRDLTLLQMSEGSWIF